MPQEPEPRPDPEILLRSLAREDLKEGKGRLKIFFGMCAGVGKTYEMLQAAQDAKKKGVDVVIGYVETHGRPETQALVAGLPVIPRIAREYRNVRVEEMDIDAILARKPVLVLVDELAHTNAPGSRHTKRYLDVIELLDRGIDVYTTINVQHLESRADAVAQITGAVVHETVPDSIFERADEVELMDLPPDELLRRLSEGKVYTAERTQRAVQSFFRKGNLTALREMALRLTTERVGTQLREYADAESIRGPWKSGERLVVGITPSRDSVRLIRWARRLRSNWIAVFVDRSAPLNGQDKQQFAKNVALARELGAEIVTTADEDVAAALVRVAKERNATQIVVGRPGRSLFWRKSLVDRLVALSGGVDVHVISTADATDERTNRFAGLPEIHSGFPQYAVSAGIILLVSAICFPLQEIIGYQTVSLILLMTVVLLPLRLGVGPVTLGALLSALIWDFFFIPPLFTFYIAAPQDVLMALTYFVIAAVTGVLTVRIRARERGVRSREQRAVSLYSLTNDLSSARNQQDVVQAAVANLKRVFSADCAVFLSDLDGDFIHQPHRASTFFPDEKEISVPAWVHWNEKPAGRFTETLPFAKATYYPLTGPRYPLGVLGVRTNGSERLSVDQEALLANSLNQIASALEREFLNELAKQSIALAESERLYTTLFNSISHEMRTPITALLGASETLLNDSQKPPSPILRDLAHEIQSAAERLDDIVQNLLAMTRLESGLIRPNLDWTDIRDVINSSVGKLSRELSGRILTVNVHPAVPLLMLDFPLMEQALANLLRNAAVHTPEGSAITIEATFERSECVISVADTGPGFPVESLKAVFNKFYRVPGSKPGGVGLGLSIAKGFVEAHRGTISVENGVSGGARFTIRIPVRETNQSSLGPFSDEQTDRIGH